MEAQKKSARRACAAILAAAALWGVIGIWNRRLMAAGLSPTSIVTVRNCGGMVLLGLGAGFFYALYSIFGRYALAHYVSMTVTTWTFLFAGPASLVLLRPSELAAAFSAPGTWLTAAGLVAVSTAAPYLLYTWGLARVESGRASILASLEPVMASLAGTLLFHEPLSAATLAGIACVLAGVSILR